MLSYLSKTVILLLISTTLFATSDTQKVNFLTDYLLKEKLEHRDPSKSPEQLRIQARNEALASVYGKPEFETLKYDETSEMFFGRIRSSNGNFIRDINFFMPKAQAHAFNRKIDTGTIKINHVYKDGELTFQNIDLNYKGINYPLHVEQPNTYTLRIGGFFIASQDTNLLAKKNGIGATLNLQDLFNMEQQTQATRVEGIYKFNPKHRLELSWYKVNNSSHNDNATSFEFDGQTVEAGAYLDIKFDTQITKFTYAYSAYQTSRLALDFRVGLHSTGITTGYKASYNIADINKTNSAESLSVTAPLPVVGVGLNYALFDNLNLRYAMDYFFISYDSSVTGRLTDTVLALDYTFNRYFGLGGGINTTNMRFKTHNQDVNFELRHEVTGIMWYAAFTY